jgi:hypothetical protein
MQAANHLHGRPTDNNFFWCMCMLPYAGSLSPVSQPLMSGFFGQLQVPVLACAGGCHACAYALFLPTRVQLQPILPPRLVGRPVQPVLVACHANVMRTAAGKQDAAGRVLLPAGPGTQAGLDAVVPVYAMPDRGAGTSRWGASLAGSKVATTLGS